VCTSEQISVAVFSKMLACGGSKKAEGKARLKAPPEQHWRSQVPSQFSQNK
jgi:hypothetical protein